MKNDYEIRGNVTAIFIESNTLGKFETLIDTEDLERLKEIDVHWYPNKLNTKKSRTLYVTAPLKIDGKYKMISLHRTIMNPSEGLEVDHINHNGMDNRKGNLRILTHAQNCQNFKGARKTNKTGIRGVSIHKKTGLYRAAVTLNGKQVYHKYFKDIKEAENAVINARKKYLPFSTN